MFVLIHCINLVIHSLPVQYFHALLYACINFHFKGLLDNEDIMWTNSRCIYLYFN